MTKKVRGKTSWLTIGIVSCTMGVIFETIFFVLLLTSANLTTRVVYQLVCFVAGGGMLVYYGVTYTRMYLDPPPWYSEKQ